MEAIRGQLGRLALATLIAITPALAFAEDGPKKGPYLADSEIIEPNGTVTLIPYVFGVTSREDIDDINAAFAYIPVVEGKLDTCTAALIDAVGTTRSTFWQAAKWVAIGLTVGAAFSFGLYLGASL